MKFRIYVYFTENSKMNNTQRKYTDLVRICIPGIDISYTKQYIARMVMKIGIIKYIAEIPLKTNNRMKRVILYISPNKNSSEYQYIHNRFESGMDVKLFYAGDLGEKPLFWKIAPFDVRSEKFVESYIKHF